MVHIIGAGLALHAITRIKRAQSCIAWTLALLGLPYIAIPLYVFFSQSRFYGYVNSRQDSNKRFKQHYEQPPHGPESIKSLKDLASLEALAAGPFTTGNKFTLLVDGMNTFDTIFADIGQARRFICVQFYRIRNDDLGQRFAAALKKAADRGVTVYLIYDELGSKLPSNYLDDLEDHGVHTTPFNAMKGLWRFFHINFRNHRKIVIIDGHIAFIGGHNVGDEYIGHHKKLSPWRDTHVRVEGPAARDALYIFMEDWFWATEVVPEITVGERSKPWPGQTIASVISLGPDADLDNGILLFMDLIGRAKKRLWIVSPYFVPEESIEHALHLAALRGVDVRIMLPDRADHLLVWLAAYTYFEDGLSAGIKFYRYQDGFLHQKVALVDDQITLIGTKNLDNRSLRLNFEVSIMAHDTAFTKKTESMLLDDFKNSELIAEDIYSEKPFWFRLACRLSRLFSPLL